MDIEDIIGAALLGIVIMLVLLAAFIALAFALVNRGLWPIPVLALVAVVVIAATENRT